MLLQVGVTDITFAVTTGMSAIVLQDIVYSAVVVVARHYGHVLRYPHRVRSKLFRSLPRAVQSDVAEVEELIGDVHHDLQGGFNNVR